MIPDEMREIFEEYVVEAKEHLENLEQKLLELEKNPKDKELINSAFRSMHTIKGGAGFLGLNVIVETAHLAEEVLGKLRSEELELTPEINDLLLKSVDFLKHALECYLRNEECSLDQELCENLKAISAGGKVQPKKEEKSIEELLEEFGLSHLKGKPVEDILEELVLLPPDKRPKELISALEREIYAEKVPAKIEEEVEEEANKLMLEYAKEGLLGEEVLEVVVEEEKEERVEEEKREEIKEVKAKEEKRKEEEGERVLRIDVQKIENLMNLVGELVLERNRLLRLSQSMAEEGLSKKSEELEVVVSSIDRIVGDLQLAVMKTRMQPVKKLFQKFPRVARDLSRMLGKEVELITEGEDTEMDKSLIERLEEPLIHIIRNAVDHGIEPPDERERLGKTRAGQIRLKAYYQGDRVFISVEDDGRGIDVEKVKAKAIEKGVATKDRLEKMTEKEILSLVFSPGFSTADRVSEVSGRGVGMDVVMDVVMRFRGTVDLFSEKGKGTRVVMSFPLTVGIIKSLLVSIGGRLFAIPIHSVLEIVSGDEAQISLVSGEEVLILRGNTIPLINLGEVLGIQTQKVGFVVVVLIGNRRVAMAVEDMLGDEEVVIKPLGKFFGDVEGISGATITGDGSIVLILDPVGLVRRFVGVF
jgi:two-component system, chemotaxis family, sensor kinase CheA